jgi:hypothetical protein
LLNKGRKYKPKDQSPPIDRIVVRIESAIQQFEFSDKASIRRQCGKVLKELKPNLSQKTKDEWKTIALLKEKNCCCIKADKSNVLVIMDKAEYMENMEKKS